MAYQLPQRPHLASRWLTATLIGIYAIIIALVVMLSSENSGSFNPGKNSGYSRSGSHGTTIKNAGPGSYRN